ncbi:hypothetical protein R1flu_008640 [Riccia fluitans]|uniref:Uncharacterized protein n=1 Tax=Riccia fluitans TaxID=41844 RepID=A0ABD1YCX5_9MARC
MGLRGRLPIPAGDLPSSLPAAVAVGSDNAKVGESSTVTLKEQTTVSTSAVVGEGEPTKQVEGGIVKKEERSLALAVKTLTGLLACKEVKVVQKAIIARGHLCFGDANPDLLSASLSALFTLSKSKVRSLGLP